MLTSNKNDMFARRSGNIQHGMRAFDVHLDTSSSQLMVAIADTMACCSAGPLAEGDDIENELDVLDSMLADELWDRLLQAATLLAECLPAFAAAAAASKWVQEVIEGDYVENEAISDMELRLFCQTAVHNAPLQQF